MEKADFDRVDRREVLCVERIYVQELFESVEDRAWTTPRKNGRTATENV